MKQFLLNLSMLKKALGFAAIAGVFLFSGLVSPQGQAEAQTLTPLEINRDQLVEMAVTGYIREPFVTPAVYRITPEGKAIALPGTGSITYNYRTGDSAVDMAGDHVEPAVSITNDGDEQRALNVLVQVGNKARVVTGDAKGLTGTVIGKHGGIENVMVDFKDEVFDKLTIGDRIQVRVVGLGMEALNMNDLYIRNSSPDLIDAMTAGGMGINQDGKLVVPVTHIIPAKIMGSGIGQNQVHSGDYDIQMFDEGINERYNLNALRFGDIVAIKNADNAHGRIYREGAWTIGIVVHGISNVAGHGPGVTTLLTSPGGAIEPMIDSGANLGNLMDVR